MKRLVFILLAFIAINAKAQDTTTTKVDSVVKYIKPGVVSIALGDTIIIQKGAIEIEPIIVSAQGDTARSIGFMAFGVTPDSTQGCQTYVQLYDANGKSVAQFNYPVPAEIKNVWLDDKVIYDWIFKQNPRFKKAN